MKIVLLTRTLNAGGAERQLVNLAVELRRMHHDVYVVMLYDGLISLKTELQQAGVELSSLQKGGRWDVFSFFIRLYSTVKRINPDVIYGFLGTPNCLTICLKPLFQKTKMVWGVRASFLDLKKYDWLVRSQYKVECFLARFADLIISNSYAGLDYAVKNGFPQSEMTVISNGIDVTRFSIKDSCRKRMRQEWGVDDATFVIGFVARLDLMKDHATFLQAVSLLLEDGESIKAVCIGGGREPYKTQLKKLTQQQPLNGAVLWFDKRDDIQDCMNGFDIFVSASYGEGFSNTIAEAMACGVPCVVTDVGDSARIVGELGEVVEARQPKSLAAGIKKMKNRIELKKEPLSNLNSQRIRTKYTNTIMAEETEKCLLSLLK